MPLTEKQKRILKRSSVPKTASNYSDAVDANYNKIGDIFTKIADDLTSTYGDNIKSVMTNPIVSTLLLWKGKIPTAKSNCTLTATQWVNPDAPISRAQTIIDEGHKYGYHEIPKEYALPGDLIIATNPKTNAHHTMLLQEYSDKDYDSSFMGKNYRIKKGDPLVRYSNGSTNDSGYRNSIALQQYIDNSHGKTNIRYFTHLYPNEHWPPEVIVYGENKKKKK